MFKRDRGFKVIFIFAIKEFIGYVALVEELRQWGASKDEVDLKFLLKNGYGKEVGGIVWSSDLSSHEALIMKNKVSKRLL